MNIGLTRSKTFTLLLCGALLCFIAVCSAQTAYADEVADNSVDTECQVQADGFYNDFKYYEGSTTVAINGYRGTEESLSVPATINGKPVTSFSFMSTDTQPVKSIDFHAATDLDRVELHVDSLETVNLSGLSKATWVLMNSASFRSIDVAGCSALESLTISGGMDDTATITRDLTQLDVSSCTKLKQLHVGLTGIPSIDLSKNTLLEEVWLYNNELRTLDLSANTKLWLVNCEYNKLTQLTLPSTAHDLVTSINCKHNYLPQADVDALHGIVGFGTNVNIEPQKGAAEASSLASQFTDVKTDEWYVTDNYLSYVLDNGIMSGYAGTATFGPLDSVTRGQVAVILYRYDTDNTAESTDNNVTTAFSDVPSGQYYSAAVKWANDNGVVTGYTGTDLFDPDKPVTREELATMIGRYASAEGIDITKADSSKFDSLAGAESVQGFAVAGMVFCADTGLITGVGGTDLAPHDSTWRASVAKVITLLDTRVLA